ncbi:MAG TPA: hypothetical protein VI893_06880, partial [Thermoplasmata archaeon]|nr:hypothetical protein [Thermoplasmata archaeon]
MTNFTLNASAIGKNNTPGEGHYHIFLDGVYKDLSGYDTFNLTRLKAGNHTLKVQLFNNNHSAVVPAVFDEISITVLGQAPSLTIVDPLPNAQVDSASVEVTLNVTFFDLNGSAIGKPNKAGEGHWHVYLNGVLAKMGATMKFDLTNLSAAQYNLRVDLRNNDHTELQPPVFDQITIKILPGRPAIAIKAPADGSSWNSTTVPYSLYLENFVFNESAIGKNNTPGEGHYHIFIDGVYARFGATPTGNLTNLTAGTHAVRFQLHENNHSARDPLVWDTVSMHVYPPGVRITSPANGTKLATNSTSVTYAASNFTLNASAIGKAWSPGEGHVHIMVDGVDTGMSASTTITVKDLADGIRKITVELRNNDHTPLQPIVAHSIWVDVDTTPPPPPAPGVKIDSPANGTKLKTNSTTVSFTVSDFTLNGSAMGGANKPGEGHVHVLVDGNVSGMIAT